MDDIAARLARLEAKDAMLDLLYAYGRALDVFDEAGVRAIVSPHVQLRHDAVGTPMESADAMLAVLMASKPNLKAAQHFITNPRVEVTGDGTGVIRASIFAMHEIAGDGPPRHRLVPAGGAYTMFVARVDGAWRIERLDIEEMWFDDRIAQIYAGSQV